MTYLLNSKNNFIKSLLILLFMIHSTLLWSQEYDATLQWSQKTGLGTVVSGIVEQVYVDAGDKIKKGEKLLQLDTSVFQARVVEYRAKLKSAGEHLKEMERERDRALELYERTVLSEHDLQMAKNNYITAKAGYEKVRASLTEHEFHLKYSVIRAPFNAIVLLRNAQPGQVIATQFKQEPVMVVAAADKMLARLLVQEKDLKNLSKGKAAKIEVEDIIYNGKIQSIGLEMIKDREGKSGFPVDVEFATKEAILRSGQTAKVDIQ